MGKVIAKSTAFVAGHLGPIREGQVFDEDSRIVRLHPGLFEAPEAHAKRKQPVTSSRLLKGWRDVHHRGGVEQATAAPGERRSVSVPEEPDPDLVCRIEVDGEECGFVARTSRGLSRHQSVHQDNE